MKACVLIVVTACAFTFAATIKSAKNAQSNGGISPLISLVATADGKSYFVDTSEKRNWTAAANYCKGYGLRLASITSESQWASLNNSVASEFIFGYYWTAGRDSQTIGQFRWDHNEAELSAAYLPWFRRSRPYYSCVDFLKYTTEAYLSHEDCVYREYTLCESSH